ncbi:DUF2244 domain-containing protein [Herbaspirillum sp. WKF16]|jgi:uncharacterized membrane protein|uniref:DUF2244 domain-containing protein n=1 Tax=Herbaspirillum sp. WKF16 TaxID=3028312 RepID=UPI0023A9AB4E|nr:DUF2244 domain-containing protein [Herbaspirillum sp. WKF16]WDZ95536.1 DUF2244 domain-containing protein [Herbaspirillum sp. WKF16]
METREWILKRNCSIAPRQLAWVFAILCTVSLTVALAFTVHGAWTILVFSVIELSAVGIAFLVYARHATDREYLVLQDDCLVVELTQAGKASRIELDLRRARIDFSAGRRSLVALESSGLRVEVGRFMSEWKRCEFARELERELSQRTAVLAKF